MRDAIDAVCARIGQLGWVELWEGGMGLEEDGLGGVDVEGRERLIDSGGQGRWRAGLYDLERAERTDKSAMSASVPKS